MASIYLLYLLGTVFHNFSEFEVSEALRRRNAFVVAVDRKQVIKASRASTISHFKPFHAIV